MINSLDEIVAQLALKTARQLLAKGYALEQAAALACPGAWAQWRGAVLAAICHDDARR